MTVSDNINETNSFVLAIISYNVASRTAVGNGSFDYQVNFTAHAYLEGKSSVKCLMHVKRISMPD